MWCGEKGAKKRSLSREQVFLGGGRLQKVAPLVIFYTTERSTTHCSAMMINKYTLHSSGKEGDDASFGSEDDDDDGGDDDDDGGDGGDDGSDGDGGENKFNSTKSSWWS